MANRILGADGRPASTTSEQSAESALDFLQRAGVTRSDDGGLVVSPEALERIRAERLRGLAVSAVPSVPRHLFRTGGGVGVQKGHGQFETLSLRALRKIRERSPMLQAIHAARSYQMRRMARRFSGRRGDVGWRIVHRDHTERNAKPPEGFDRVINGFEELWTNPAPRYQSSPGQLLAQLEEDFLTINRPCVEVLYSMLDPDRIVGWRAVDGELVWPTLLWLERWQADNPGWAGKWQSGDLSIEEQIELASEAIGWDLYGAEYCLVREGTLEAVYPPGKLIVAPLQSRTDVAVAGYPPSHVEQAIEVVLSHINAFDYNATYFTRGMMAEFILGISGDVHDDDVQAFVDMFRESTQGVRHAWQPPVMPLPVDGTIQKIDLRASNRDMMMELWMSVLGALSAAVYRIDMSSVNMKPWDGGSGPSLSEGSREREIALAKEEGLQGDLAHLNESIFDRLARRVHPDLRIVWEFGDVDTQREATVNEARARVATTRNEIRLELGEPPMGFWVPPEKVKGLSDEDRDKYEQNLWNMPSDPSFVSAMQQAAMMAQQQGMQGAPGPAGPDDGFGGAQADDGFGQPDAYPYGAPPGGGAPAGPAGGPGAPPGAAPGGPPPGGGAPAPMAKAMRRGALPAPRRGKVTVYVEEV